MCNIAQDIEQQCDMRNIAKIYIEFVLCGIAQIFFKNLHADPALCSIPEDQFCVISLHLWMLFSELWVLQVVAYPFNLSVRCYTFWTPFPIFFFLCSLQCDQQPGSKPSSQRAWEADPGEYPSTWPQASHQGWVSSVHSGEDSFRFWTTFSIPVSHLIREESAQSIQVRTHLDSGQRSPSKSGISSGKNQLSPFRWGLI
jgi:hypothetical protein